MNNERCPCCGQLICDSEWEDEDDYTEGWSKEDWDQYYADAKKVLNHFKNNVMGKYKIHMKHGDREYFEEVEGHPVKIPGLEEFSFFTHKDFWGHHISEEKTGRSISCNLFSLTLAIKEARKRILDNIETFKAAVKAVSNQ